MNLFSKIKARTTDVLQRAFSKIKARTTDVLQRSFSKIKADSIDILQQKRWGVFVAVLSVALSLKTPSLVPPKDVLSVLPTPVSLRILRSFKPSHELLPTYVGSVSAKVPALDWDGFCFDKTSARLVFHEKAGSELGGGTLYIKFANPHSWTCKDHYIFATPYRVLLDSFFYSKTYEIEFEEWKSKDEYEYVRNTGISIFLIESGVLGALAALTDALPLLSNSEWGEDQNIAFLKKHMNAKFEERPKPWITEINVDDVHSGDFLVISKIRGRWGAFQTLQKWVTGAHAGHTAVFLKKQDGKLFVAESGHQDEKGEKIIVVVPWEEWWNLQLKDDANPHIAILPLRPKLRAKFDAAAAWEYVESMQGKPYGYHNMLFSWIDTEVGNYPPPIDAHLVACAITIWDKFHTTSATRMWTEALNKRLGTREDLNLTEIMEETEKQGISFGKLLTIPEQDDWVYSDGKSVTCVVLVIQIYKKAGLFGDLASSIQATEFTVKDAYILNLFEEDPNNLPKWCNARDPVKLPFCQIRGRYRMELPGYNSLEPYSRMNEKCTSLPPNYNRDAKC